MAALELRGKRVYCHDGGVAWTAERPAAIFLHGAGMDHSLWQQQSRALAHHGFNVAVPDLPGHGESEDLPAIASIADYALWLDEFRAACGFGRVALVGHSMGACLALSYAAAYPQHVSALALAGAGLTMPVSAELLTATRDDFPRAVGFITAYGHGRPTHLGGAPVPGAWVLGSAAALLDAGTSEVLHRDFQVCNQWDGTSLAPAITCPTLVVSGQGDRMTPPRAGKALADAVPGSRYELLSGCGHLVPTEAPRVLLRLLREFLAPVEKTVE